MVTTMPDRPDVEPQTDLLLESVEVLITLQERANELQEKTNDLLEQIDHTLNNLPVI